MATNDTPEGRYPHLCFEKRWHLDQGALYALGECDAMVEAIGQAPLLPHFRRQLHLISLRKGAQATTAIEGNTLTEEEVARIDEGEVLPSVQEYQQREVQNVIDAFNTLLTEVVTERRVELISPDLLLRFHYMIGKDLGEHFSAVPGEFAHAQRIVGPYRPPAANDVPRLVESLCTWLREEFHYPQQRFSDAIIQAIVTHVYIEWIHPFDDGNGRTGRLMEFYILLRAGLPSLASHLLANHYNEGRSEYYRQLHVAKQQQDLSGFIEFALTGLRNGLRASLNTVQQNALEQMWRVLVYDTFGDRSIGSRTVFKRRRAAALALPLDRPIRFDEVADLSEELASAYADSSNRTLLRDLAELEKMNLIEREPGLVRANRSLLMGTIPTKLRRALADA